MHAEQLIVWVRHAASPRLTLVLIAALAATVSWSYLREESGSILPVVTNLGLLELNLLAAIISNPAFRRQLPLLIFHIALAGVVLLAGVGQMSRLKATAEVTVGTAFEGEIERVVSGPWHAGDLAAVRFINDGFEVSYMPGPRRDRTINRVRWTDADGVERQAEIGDHRPLVLRGYRFYTTPNKGFAPTFTWQPNAGAPISGNVHLPSYPANEDAQWQDWELPGFGQSLWTGLVIEERILDPDQVSVLRLPERHHVALRLGDERWVMRPGDRRTFPHGTLIYEGLGMYMGYDIYHDWTLQWIFAASAVAVLAMAAHFWLKFSRRSWQE